jgi:hypothetical protein
MEHVCPQLGTPVEGRVPYFSSMEKLTWHYFGVLYCFMG